jgi:prepilin-type N-terminal cleavage/methylation domain-containing protein
MKTQFSTSNFQHSTSNGKENPSLKVECWKLNVECCAPIRRDSRAGLTLIEVMLALVILGMGMVALVTAAGRCISVARQAKNFDTARELLAQVEVEKPMMLEENVEDIAGSGSFESPNDGFSWTRTIEQHGYEEDGLWEVVTEIKWTEDERAKRESVNTLIYWPEDKEGGSVESAP